MRYKVGIIVDDGAISINSPSKGLAADIGSATSLFTWREGIKGAGTDNRLRGFVAEGQGLDPAIVTEELGNDVAVAAPELRLNLPRLTFIAAFSSQGFGSRI